MTTALTLPQRAAVALNSSKYEQDLLALIDQSKDLVEAKDNTGRDQIHRAAMSLANARIAITKVAKAAREDATAFSSAVIAEQNRLIGIVKPHEDRLFAARDIWDEKIEAEKQAKIAAERLRIETIKKSIDRVRDLPALCVGQSISGVEQILNDLNETGYKDTFYEEFLSEVESVAQVSKDKISHLLVELKQAEIERIQKQQERDAEIIRLQAERAENERIRKELAEQQAIAEAKAAEQRKAIELEQAKAKAAQDQLNAERAAFEAKKQAKIDAENKAIAAADFKRQQELNAIESAKQAELDKQKFEAEQSAFIAAMQESITPEKIADKLIEKSINFNIDKLAFETDLKGNIIKVNGFCRGDVISAFINYVDINSLFHMSSDDADRIISTLFTTKD